MSKRLKERWLMSSVSLRWVYKSQPLLDKSTRACLSPKMSNDLSGLVWTLSTGFISINVEFPVVQNMNLLGLEVTIKCWVPGRSHPTIAPSPTPGATCSLQVSILLLACCRWCAFLHSVELSPSRASPILSVFPVVSPGVSL